MRPTERLVLNDRPTQEVTGHRTGCRLQHRADRGPGERRGRRLRNTWSVKTVPLLTPWTPPCPGRTRCPTIFGPARADVGSSTQMAEPQRTVAVRRDRRPQPAAVRHRPGRPDPRAVPGRVRRPLRRAEALRLHALSPHGRCAAQLHQRRPAPATQLRSGQLRRHRLYERHGARAPHRRYNAFSVDITSALRSKRRKRSWWRCTLRRTAPPSRLASSDSTLAASSTRVVRNLAVGLARASRGHEYRFLHGDTVAGRHLRAPADAALKFDIQKTKDLGVNTIRKHIKIEPARWYSWADKLGMMVWQDSPALPAGRNDSLTAGDKANFRAETAQIVTQLRDVTSIIGWTRSTKAGASGACRRHGRLRRQVKKQDPSRLVDDRSGSNCGDTLAIREPAT